MIIERQCCRTQNTCVPTSSTFMIVVSFQYVIDNYLQCAWARQ